MDVAEDVDMADKNESLLMFVMSLTLMANLLRFTLLISLILIHGIDCLKLKEIVSLMSVLNTSDVAKMETIIIIIMVTLCLPSVRSLLIRK